MGVARLADPRAEWSKQHQMLGLRTLIRESKKTSESVGARPLPRTSAYRNRTMTAMYF
jgi:hypothetical protein